MACNCNEEGKVINIGLGCCVPIVANADAYYTKSEIDEKIDDIVISGGGITSGEVQTMIDSSIADKADKSEIPTVPKNVSAFVNDVPYLTEHQSLTDYATKQWVEDKHYITGVDLSDYALKEEIPDINGYATEQWVNDQGFLKTHQSLEGYATENWVQSQGYLTQHQDLSDYALKSEIPDISGLASETYVSNYTYDKATIDQKVAEGGTFDPTQYYNKTQTNQLLSEKADTATTYSKVEVDSLLFSKANKSDLSDYYNKSQTDVLLDEKLDASAYTPTDLTNYYTKSETNSQIDSSTADMATKTWVQNQGYLTEHQDLSSYALKSEIPDVNDKLDVSAFNTYSANTNTTINGKQDTLSASSGISITNDEISTKIGNGLRYAQDGTLEVNSTNAIASGNTQVPLSYVVHNYINNNCVLKSKIWCGTQSEFDSITTKDSETIYLIHE